MSEESLFGLEELPAPAFKGRFNIAEAHRLQCKVCPLNLIKTNRHPNMAPTGADEPLVYIMAEAPGKQEDIEGVQLIGKSGQILRARVPRQFKDRVRYNNTVRTRPPDNRTPTPLEVECCRPSVEQDIAATKPKAIFGLGDVPLRWVCDFSGITLWRGRRMPVNILGHKCWYYPMLHPAYLLYEGRKGMLDAERLFVLDIQHAFEEVEHLPPPDPHDVGDVFKNIECQTEFGSKGVARVKEALLWATERPEVGVDFETSALRPYSSKAKLLTIAVSTRKRSFAFPIEHPEAEWTDNEYRQICDYWMKFCREHKGRKWVHNLAFELEWTGVYFGRSLIRAGIWEDTAGQACVLDERRGKMKPGPFSLEFLVQQYFGFNLKKLSNVDRAQLADESLDMVLRYNGADAKYHCYLGLALEQEIARFGLKEANRLQQRRVPTVVLTQIKGVLTDPEETKVLSEKYEERLEELGEKIQVLPVIQKFEKAKVKRFKILSNPDVLYVFRDMLQRPECRVEDKYTGKLKYSVDKNVLEQIDHPLAELLREYREANKRKSTYIDPLDPELAGSAVHEDDKIHTIFNTIFAETGRLTSEEPNLQNFPKRDDEAKEVRKQIVAKPGCVILSVDYGQIEARVIAMFSKDKAFCNALWENYDVHMEWAERIARAYPARIGGKKFLSDKQVMKTFRTDIKNQWTFPLFFGAKLESAAGYLKIPVDKIEAEYNRFWKVFDGVKVWQEKLEHFYYEHGYVECLTGRRRRAPLSLNQLINSPVQGTAAEIVLDGMSRLSETRDWDLQPEINIHDDLTFTSVPLKKIDDIAEKIVCGMLDVPFKWVNVPITAELSIGDDWLNMKEVETFSSDDKWFKDRR